MRTSSPDDDGDDSRLLMSNTHTDTQPETAAVVVACAKSDDVDQLEPGLGDDTPASPPPSPDEQPFKVFPILMVALALFSNALSFTMPFAFVGFLTGFTMQIEDVKTLGYWSGAIGGVFMLGRMVTARWFGKYADRKGRRGPMLFSLFLSGFITVLFGFSFSTDRGIGPVKLGYIWALFTRCLLGLTNAIPSTAKVMCSELAPDRLQPRAMSLIALTFSMGLVAGPSMGGLLYDPADKFPNTAFFQTPFWRHFPALLPALPPAAFAFGTFILSYFYLPETLDRSRHVKVDTVPMKAPSTARHSVQDASSVESDDGTPREGKPDDGDIEMVSLSAASPGHKTGGYAKLVGTGTGAGVGAGTGAGTGTGTGAGTGAGAGVGASAASPATRHKKKQKKKQGYDELGDGDSSGDDADDGETGLGETRRAVSEPDVVVSIDAGPSAPILPSGGKRSPEELDADPTVPISKRSMVWLTVSAYTLWSLIVIAVDETMPLWLMAPRDVGGLDWDSNTIGTVLGLMGIPVVFYQLLFFPSLNKKMGSVLMMRVMSVLMFPTVALLVVSIKTLSGFMPEKVAVGIVLTFERILTVSTFTALFMTINNSVPPNFRGEVQGVALLVASAGKAAGPFLAPLVLAFSLTKGERMGFPFDANFVFLLLGLLVLVTAVIMFRAPASLNVKWETRQSDREERARRLVAKR